MKGPWGPARLVKRSRFEFRPLAESDLPLLAEWLSRPHLQEWWREGEITLDGVREKYLPRIAGDDDAVPFIVHQDGVPIGYIQYCRAWIHPEWWPDDPGKGVYGIDQFIADEDRLNRGIGTGFIEQFVRFLMEDPAVVEVRVDPRPDNGRAIRCYEKVGFARVGDMVTPHGPATLMVLTRSSMEDP